MNLVLIESSVCKTLMDMEFEMRKILNFLMYKTLCNLIYKIPLNCSRILIEFKWTFSHLPFLDFAFTLRDVKIIVPTAVRRGENVNLICQYELEPDETLYSMKWYKGKREFFRYTPKENPPWQQFPVPGISVDVSVRKFNIYFKTHFHSEIIVHNSLRKYDVYIFHLNKISIFILLNNFHIFPLRILKNMRIHFKFIAELFLIIILSVSLSLNDLIYVHSLSLLSGYWTGAQHHDNLEIEIY